MNPLPVLQKTIINLIDFIYPPFSKILPIETFRYAATGGANTILDIFLYFICYSYVIDKQIIEFEFIAISPHIAAFLFVFPFTFTTGFLLAKYITFTSSSMKGRVQLFRYGVTVGGAILMNYVLLKLFVENFGIDATLSKILTTVIVVTYSYFIQRFYSFKTGKLLKKEIVD